VVAVGARVALSLVAVGVTGGWLLVQAASRRASMLVIKNIFLAITDHFSVGKRSNPIV
jgi:hypothetical protein